MKIRILDIKTEMEVEGMKILDFTSASFRVNYYDPRLRIDKIVRCEERHIARPDLIAYEAYKNIDNTDVILKINQITNPFSINEGDILVIPNLLTITSFYESPEKSNDIPKLNTKFLFIDPSRASQKDVNRLKQLERISRSRRNGSKENKPTNLLREGEAPFRTQNGALRLSPDNSKGS